MASTGGVGIAPAPVINPGGVRRGAVAPKVSAPKVTAAPKPSAAMPPRPTNPSIGGHYVKVGNQWQLIHAVGPGRWVRGPVPAAGPGVATSNPLLNPNTNLSGQSLYDAAKALADAQTVGPLAELNKQIAANNRQTQAALQTTGGYFNRLGQYNQLGVGLEGNIANDLNAKLAQIGADTQGQIAGTGLQAAAALNKYTPQSDDASSLSAPAMSSLVAEVARQRGLAAQAAGAAQSAGATQGANYGSLAASNLGSQALAGQQTLGQIAQSGTVANQPLNAKIADLQAQRGALLTTDLGKLRQQEVSNALTRQGILGQNARAQASIDAANTRSQNTIAAENQRQAKSLAAAATRQDKSLAAAEKKAAARANKPPITANENNRYLTDLGRAVSLYGQGRQAKLSPQQILTGLTTGRNPAGRSIGGSINPVIAQAALELWTYHFLNPRTAKALHDMGIRGGTFQGAPIQVGGPTRGVGQVASGVGKAVGGVGAALGKALTGK